MIKPDAVKNNHRRYSEDDQRSRIPHPGYEIHPDDPRSGRCILWVHKERPFYGELVDFMSSGPIVAAVLVKDNAVEDFRKLIGATNPAEAADGTIRKMYATSIGENAVHGSDSDENAAIEAGFHFSAYERF